MFKILTYVMNKFVNIMNYFVQIYVKKILNNSLSTKSLSVAMNKIVHNIKKFVQAYVKILNIHNINKSLLKSS